MVVMEVTNEDGRDAIGTRLATLLAQSSIRSFEFRHDVAGT